jgi:hypothetical protein
MGGWGDREKITGWRERETRRHAESKWTGRWGDREIVRNT